MGVFRESNFPYVSPIVVVKKKMVAKECASTTESSTS